jgi:hypothetical protein
VRRPPDWPLHLDRYIGSANRPVRRSAATWPPQPVAGCAQEPKQEVVLSPIGSILMNFALWYYTYPRAKFNVYVHCEYPRVGIHTEYKY